MPEMSRENQIDRMQRVIEANLGIPAFEGNRLEVLQNGIEIFPRMLKAIESAERSVDLLTFVYWKGEIAWRFARTLAAAARRKVRVRVLLDGVGAIPMKEALVDLMEDAGVEVAWFRPPVRWKLWQSDNRTHRKILVCDRMVGFTGGVGIAEEWEGNARNPSEWRDTQVRVEGPAVRGLEAAFLTNWQETGRLSLAEVDNLPGPKTVGSTPVHVVRSAAMIGWSDVASLFRSVIGAARRRLWITTAYFVPDDAAVDLLCETQKRGVDVRVLVPGQYMDKRVSGLAGSESFKRLLQGNIAIWRYQKTMIHAKVLTVDGVLALVGSPNFNHRSMKQDDEVCLVVPDPEFTARLDADFEQDLAYAERLTEKSWEQRGLLRRIGERVSQLVKPQA
jgi:cardiolipin synthase